jgi:hypothetical protein
LYVLVPLQCKHTSTSLANASFLLHCPHSPSTYLFLLAFASFKSSSSQHRRQLHSVLHKHPRCPTPYSSTTFAAQTSQTGTRAPRVMIVLRSCPDQAARDGRRDTLCTPGSLGALSSVIRSSSIRPSAFACLRGDAGHTPPRDPYPAVPALRSGNSRRSRPNSV